MGQVVLPITEGIARGYKFAQSLPAQRETPATILETGALIATEIAPAILGGIAGTFFGGPAGGAAGGSGGAAFGNYHAQNMRMDWGLSQKFGFGEFAASTALGGVGGFFDKPVKAMMGSLVKSKAGLIAANSAYRGAEGVALSEGELFARTLIDEGRMPTESEIKLTALFGGTLGGGMGALEAKFFNDTFGVPVAKPRTTRNQLVDNIVEQTGENAETANGLVSGLEDEMINQMEFVRQRVNRGEQDLVRNGDSSWEYTAKKDEEILQEAASREAREKQKALISATGARQSIAPEIGVGTVVAAPIILDEDATELDKAGAIGLGIASALGIRHLRNAFRNNFKNDWYKNQAGKALENTKAVDDTGNPIVVFHASPRAADIAEEGFDVARRGQRTGAVSARQGMFFSGKQETAQSYLPDSETGKLAKALQSALGISKKQVDGAKKAIGSALRKVNDVRALAQIEDIMGQYGLLRGKWKDKDWDTSMGRMLDDLKDVASNATRQKTRNALLQFTRDLESVVDARRSGIIAANLVIENPLEVDLKFAQRKKGDYVQLIQKAKKGGHDGLILKNTYDTYLPTSGTRQQIPDDIYVVFEPDQIVPILGKSNHKPALNYATHGGFLNNSTDASGIKHSAQKVLQQQVATGALSSAAVAGLMLGDGENDGETSLADLHHVLGVGVLAALGYRSLKYVKDMRVKVPASQRPRQLNDQVVRRGLAQGDDPYIAPTYKKIFWDSTKEVAKNLGLTMSRRLKNIDERVNNYFQELFRTNAKEEQAFLDTALPFFKQLQHKVQNNKDEMRRFQRAYLNEDFRELAKLAKDYDIDYSLYQNYAKAVREIRDRYINEAGMQLGYRKVYHSRVVKDFDSLKEYLISKNRKRDLNEIDKAIDDYAQAHGVDRDALSKQELAQITSVVLRGDMQRSGLPGHTKARAINKVSDDLLDAYEMPVQSIQNYARQSIQAINARKFLGKGLGNPTILPMDNRINDTLAGKLARDMGKQFNIVDDKQIRELQAVIQAAIKGEQASSLVSGIKTAGYLHTLANVGTSIVQLGDLAFGVHFQGAGNVFRNLYNKEMKNFYQDMGLSYDMDQPMHYGKFQDFLSKVFKVTGLDQMDQFGKNTNMHAAVQKFRKLAMTKDGRTKAYEELEPIFGDAKARDIINDLQFLPEKITKDTHVSDNIYALAWDRLSRMSVLSKLETPAASQGGKGGWHQLMYQLKTFMIKQFDTYLEAGWDDISSAKELLKQGKRQEAAKLAAKGAGSIATLMATLYAANASADVVRDTIYGRPIKADRLLSDNLFKLFLINRYHLYKMEREGGAKALLEMLMPPTAGVDRTWKDVMNFVQGREFEGNSLQGTPLDILYWHYLGGYEKARK